MGQLHNSKSRRNLKIVIEIIFIVIDFFYVTYKSRAAKKLLGNIYFFITYDNIKIKMIQGYYKRVINNK